MIQKLPITTHFCYCIFFSLFCFALGSRGKGKTKMLDGKKLQNMVQDEKDLGSWGGLGLGSISLWSSICLAFVRPWALSLAEEKWKIRREQRGYMFRGGKVESYIRLIFWWILQGGGSVHHGREGGARRSDSGGGFQFPNGKQVFSVCITHMQGRATSTGWLGDLER